MAADGSLLSGYLEKKKKKRQQTDSPQCCKKNHFDIQVALYQVRYKYAWVSEKETKG